MLQKLKNANGEGSLRQRPNGMWEYRVCVEGRKSPLSFYSRDKDGRGAKRKYREWLKSGGDVLIEKVYTVKEWAERWLKVKKATVCYGTYQNYKLYVDDFILPAIGALKLDFVRPYHIEDLFASPQVVKLSDSARNEIRVALNGIFNTALENRLCRSNPVKKPEAGSSKPPKPPEFYTLEQIGRIVAYAPGHKWGSYVLAGLYTGLRTEELCALRWSDLELKEETSYLLVRRVIAKEEPPAQGVGTPERQRKLRYYQPRELTKSKRQRTVALSPHGAALFSKLPRTGEYVFGGIKGKPFLTPPQFASRYGAVFRDMSRTLPPNEQVPMLSPHKMRHSYGSMLLDAGANIKAVQDQLGHARISTTQLYLHVDVDMLGQAAAKLPY